MNDPYTSNTSSNGAGQRASAGPTRAGMADQLQQALRALSSQRGGSSGSLTPEALTELAQRAGLIDSGQLADLARVMGAGPTTASAPSDVLFALGAVECSLPAEVVQGVERISDVAVTPNTQPWVLGIVHLRGSILSVVDLRGFFDLPTQQITSRSRLLVVTRREMSIGFVVDAVTEMRTLVDMPPVAEALPAWIAPYATHALNVEGRMVIALDPERLLFSEKIHHYQLEAR